MKIRLRYAMIPLLALIGILLALFLLARRAPPPVDVTPAPTPVSADPPS